MRFKIIGYLIGFFFLISISFYSYEKYEFTKTMPSSPELSSGRVIEMDGYYEKNIFVTSKEAKLIDYLKYAAFISGALFFMICARYSKPIK
jgi:hypothetical protein